MKINPENPQTWPAEFIDVLCTIRTSFGEKRVVMYRRDDVMIFTAVVNPLRCLFMEDVLEWVDLPPQAVVSD